MEKQSLSAPTIDPPPLRAEPNSSAPAPAAPPAPAGAAAVLAPIAMALLALLLNGLLPGTQAGTPSNLYPGLLVILLAGGLALTAAWWAAPALRPWAEHYGPLLAGALAWLAAWDAITTKLAWMPLPFFPGPDAVLQGMQEDWALLLASAFASLQLLLTGYAAGVALGLGTGVLMGWFRGVRYWGMPVMKAIGPIPATALVPLAMVLFTSSFASGAALIALAAWFPVTMLTSSGIANVPASYFDVARTLGARPGYLIFRVAIPAALPTIFIGLFMGLLVSFLTLIVAETVGVKNGLGYYIAWRKGGAEYDKVYGALVISSVFFSTIIMVMFKVRDRVLQWQKGVIRW